MGEVLALGTFPRREVAFRIRRLALESTYLADAASDLEISQPTNRAVP